MFPVAHQAAVAFRTTRAVGHVGVVHSGFRCFKSLTRLPFLVLFRRPQAPKPTTPRTLVWAQSRSTQLGAARVSFRARVPVFGNRIVCSFLCRRGAR